MNTELTSPVLHLGLASDAGHDPTAWFLAVLPQLGTNPDAVTIHFGLVGVGPVLVPLFFLRTTSGKEELLLETSLNPFQDDLQGMELLRCLCSQDSYRIHCRDLATKTAQTLDVPNTHQPQYRQAVTLLEARPPWTATEFVQAQEYLAQSWSSPEERFQNLRDTPGQSRVFET